MTLHYVRITDKTVSTRYISSGVITVTDTNGVINVYNEDEHEGLLKKERATCTD